MRTANPCDGLQAITNPLDTNFMKNALTHFNMLEEILVSDLTRQCLLYVTHSVL
jgi:hypothetical protein